MNTVWIPSSPVRATVALPSSPFGALPRLSRAELAESRSQPAVERRLQLPYFVETFRWENICPHLPLQLPTPGKVPAWKGPRMPLALSLVGTGAGSFECCDPASG